MSIIENMPSADYFAVDAASNSGLKLVRRSPAHFKYREPEDGDTRAKQIGTALHAAILEPEHFAKHYLVSTVDDRRLAEYKGLAKDVGGDRVLTISEHRRIVDMQESVYRNKRASSILQAHGRRELSVFTKDPVTGVDVKFRFDFKGDGFTAADLKKCQDARGSEFVRAISNYGYYMQIAFYMDMWKAETAEDIREFPIIAVEENAPHGCICHDLDEVALMLGRKHYREALNTYAECLERGVWPAYGDDSELTSVTGWMADELFDDTSMGGIL